MTDSLYRETLRPHLDGIQSFPIFLSSASEAELLRDRVDRVVQSAFNTQLSHFAWKVLFPIWRWEDVEARAAATNASVNETFVQMARESSVVIVLLHDNFRPGTREELMAVKDDDDVNLKVLWFPRRRRAFLPQRQSEVAQFLTDERNQILYKRFPSIDSEDAWVTLVQNLVATLLKALRSQDRRPYVENR